MEPNSTSQTPRIKKPLWRFIVIAFLVIGFLAALYFYNQYQKSQQLLQNPDAAKSVEAQALLDKVRKLIELPSGEQPQVATVSDASKLPNQPFFSKAQNGDKVLIYAQAKKAILYRPSINKIIDVAPVNVGLETSPAPSASASASITPSISPTVTVSPTAIPVQ